MPLAASLDNPEEVLGVGSIRCSERPVVTSINNLSDEFGSIKSEGLSTSWVVFPLLGLYDVVFSVRGLFFPMLPIIIYILNTYYIS